MLRTVYWHPFGKLYLAISYNLAITMAWEDIASMHIKNDSWDDLASSLFARIKAIKDCCWVAMYAWLEGNCCACTIQCRMRLLSRRCDRKFLLGTLLKAQSMSVFRHCWEKEKKLQICSQPNFFLTQFFKTNFILSKLPNTDL